MRILIATAHRNLVGGVEKYLQALIPGLLERGHDLGLLHEYPGSPDRETIDPPGGLTHTWCLAKLDTVTALHSIAEWNPDIVYFHGFDAAKSVRVEDALLQAYPVFLYVHNYDRTCGTGQKCCTFPEPRACERRIGPMCLLLHYPRRCGGLNPGIMWQKYRQDMNLNARLPRHQAVLVASAHMRREMARHGVSAGKLHLVPLPATEVIPESLPPAPKPLGGNILFVGRLTAVKGADYLIRAIALAACRTGMPLHLTIAGDGPERHRLEDLAGQLGVAVEFAGWVHTRDKLNLMRQADLLAVPSLWPEPFGMVGVEAGCLGLPAVGFASGGIPDWLISGETGELAPSNPPTVDGLSEAIARAFASPEHHARLCLGAWKLAQRFTLEKHLAQLEPLLGLEPAVPVGRLRKPRQDGSNG